MDNPWKAIVAGIALALALPAVGAEETAATTTDPAGDEASLAQLETALEGLRQELRIPGISAAVVRGDAMIWARGFGFADRERSIAATPDTPYYLASLTKTFASTILLQLVAEGKIGLDDPVSRYGVHLRSKGVVTVRHLFSHTSEGSPGRAYRYHGYRFAYLGTVIEEATGKSFAELLIARIIKPLGMANTAPHGFDDDPEMAHVFHHRTRPYTLDETHAVTAGSYPDSFGVSAGLISTVVDMAKYDRAISAHRFLEPETQELAFTPTVSTAGEQLPYGLGWFTQTVYGHRAVWHYGWNPPSVSTLILKIPDQNLTFIVFGNTDELSRSFGLGNGDVLSSPFALAFVDAFLFRDRAGGVLAGVDWGAPEAELRGLYEALPDAQLRDLFRRRLGAQYLIARRFENRDEADRLLDLYAQLSPERVLDRYAARPVIAEIANPGDDYYGVADFSLQEETAVRIFAIGEGDAIDMWDFGGLEDLGTRELVWHMESPTSENAGGVFKNRRVDRTLSLAPGRYRLHYKTDDSHSYDHWNSLPPDDDFWGIKLFAEPPSAEPVAPAPVRTPAAGSEDRLLDQVASGRLVAVSAFERAIVWVCGVVFVTAWLGWGGGLLVRLVRRRKGSGEVGKARSPALRLARPVAFLGTFFFAGYLGAMMGTGALDFFIVNGVIRGLPFWIALALRTPALATALTVVMVGLTLVAWGLGFWSPGRRLHYSLVVLGAVVCAVLLARWHLLILTF